MKKITTKIIALILFASIIPAPNVSAATKQSSKTYFDKIELVESIPKTFYRNEVYVIEGNVDSSEYDTATVVLQKAGTSSKKTFTGKITNKNFSIPVFFSQAGNFNLGIIPGDRGSSKAMSTNVFTSLPLATKTITAPRINLLSMSYKNDATVIKISTLSPSLKRFSFLQGSRKVTYLSRQNIATIPINYADFENFLPGKVFFYAEVARLSNTTSLNIISDYTRSETKSFRAAEHTFAEIRSDNITANPPDMMTRISPITFSGQVHTDTELQAYVIKPNGLVDTFNLTTASKKSSTSGKQILLSGGNFKFSYTPTTKGRYILEINDKEGLPILNHPTYIGSDIPVIPDFFDVNERSISNSTFNLTSLRESLLDKINKSRQDHGLPAVEMTTELNIFAQEHSADMTKNNYFSHTNPQNQSPDDRRIAAGIQTPVSENIAKDVSVSFANEGLMRSASHRSNILQSDWTKVGLGISKKSGYLYITEEFSTSPVTPADLETYKTDLFSEINNKRTSSSIKTLTYSPSLELVAKQLNNNALTTTATLSNSTLSNALDQFGISGNTIAIGRTYNSWNPIITSFIDAESSILETKWKTIGIDIQIDRFGNIIALIILNKP